MLQSELKEGELRLELSEDALETYAEMEHRRWRASTVLAGFRLGERNERKRLHKDLKPYGELDQGTKKWDRDVIEQFPLTLQQKNAAQAGKAEK